MVRLENGVATLRPIAGTKPRGNTEQETANLRTNSSRTKKERAEHLIAGRSWPKRPWRGGRDRQRSR